MSWNCVFDFYMSVKKDYINTFGASSLFDYDKGTCLEYWVNKLNDSTYANRIKPLCLIEHEGYLLIRYGQLADIYANYEDLFSLYDGFYKEARSLVIDIVWDEIALSPFRKFHNLNECEEYSLENIQKRLRNAKRVEITDKLDGSMVSARWYHGEVLASGSQSLNPENSWRLAEYYNWFNVNENYVSMLKALPSVTFIFESISEKDPHVVSYTEDMYGLHLTGMRSSETGIEFSYEDVCGMAEAFNVPHMEVWNMTFEDVLDSIGANEIPSCDREGFVINIDNFKVKVKYDDYVLMHKALGKNVSPNYIIRALREGYWDDFYSKVPENYKPRALETANKILTYVKLKDEEASSCYHHINTEFNLKSMSRKEAMIIINEYVPDHLKGAVRNIHIGKDNNWYHGLHMPMVEAYLKK